MTLALAIAAALGWGLWLHTRAELADEQERYDRLLARHLYWPKG